MSVDKKQIVKDIQFCKDLMDRLLKDAKKYEKSGLYDDKHTVLQADIIRLRRELNEVRKKLDWDYQGGERMTRERIEDFREIALPFLSRTLLKTNYENMGKSDAEEFEKDFNEILDLAIQALEQEPILDKIRAEIMDFEEELFHRPNTDYSDYSAVRYCVEIIDKYKAESEEQE